MIRGITDDHDGTITIISLETGWGTHPSAGSVALIVNTKQAREEGEHPKHLTFSVEKMDQLLAFLTEITDRVRAEGEGRIRKGES